MLPDLMVRDSGELSQRVDLNHCVVLTIDIQNDFIHEKGGYAKAFGDPARLQPFQQMAARVDRFLVKVRRLKIPIVHICQEYTPWTMSAPYVARLTMYGIDPNGLLQPGSWGAQSYIKAAKGECRVVKHRDSAFFGTDLDWILRGYGAKTLILTGGALEGCLGTTAMDGFFRDYWIITLKDCAEGGLPEVKEAAYFRLSTIGVLTDSQTLLDAWAKKQHIQ